MGTYALVVYTCSGNEVVVRNCFPRSYYSGAMECKSESYSGHSAEVCYCDSDKCNGAVTTSSFSHVIIVTALLINVVVGYLP